ncbi:MAG: hypothetical protein WCK74_00980 [Gemmatimonadaceae bacterium]
MTLALPTWAVVSEKRHAHIMRVVALLDTWAARMDLDRLAAQAWHDAGAWHDALRGADELRLRHITGMYEAPVGLLHGPAAASQLAVDGEARRDVLEAIRWHTVGCATWDQTGRALYMADFLEPGRTFLTEERAALAARVPVEFDTVFREVVRLRISWAIGSGKSVMPETLALWEAVR